MEESQTEVQSIRRTFSIIKTILELDNSSLTSISEETDIPKSTTYRYLKSLQEEGYVVRTNDEYQLGLQFLHIGRMAQTKRKEFQYAKSITQEIAANTNERAQFAVEGHGYVCGVHKVAGERAVETDNYVGKPNPMHATSTGKAILAQWDESEVLDLVECRGLPSLTDRTITDVDELLDELETIRQTGISYNRQENTEGLHAVAVPVNLSDGTYGALNVSGPAHRICDELFESEIPNLLLGSSNELELRIQYSQ